MEPSKPPSKYIGKLFMDEVSYSSNVYLNPELGTRFVGYLGCNLSELSSSWCERNSLLCRRTDVLATVTGNKINAKAVLDCQRLEEEVLSGVMQWVLLLHMQELQALLLKLSPL